MFVIRKGPWLYLDIYGCWTTLESLAFQCDERTAKSLAEYAGGYAINA